MNRLLQWRSNLDMRPEGFLCFIRIYLGIGLMAKAVFFMSNTDYFMSMITHAGDMWFAPVMVAHYVILAHFVGGLLLAAGLVTRWAAAFQVPALIGAVFYVHLPQFFAMESRANFEFSALVLFLLCMFTVYGGGRWSMDAALEEVEEPLREAEVAHA